MRRLFHGLFSKANKCPAPARARLGVESLEGRELLSATPLTWTAPSSNGANAVVLRVSGSTLQVLDNNVVVASQAVASTSSVSLTAAKGVSNIFTVQGTAAGVPTTINCANTTDTATVGNGSSVQGILGTLTVHGAGGASKVTLDDSADTGTRFATLGSSSVTGLAPAAVNFSGVTLLTVYGSKGANNRYTINGTTGGTTTLYDRSISDAIYVYSTAGTFLANGMAGDAAYLYGPASGSNVFGATPSMAWMAGANYFNEASGYSEVFAYSKSLADSASLTGAVGGSNTLAASPTYAEQWGSGYANEAIGFPKVTAISNSSSDVAYLYGAGSGASVFHGESTWSEFYGTNYDNKADNFAKVYAYSYSVGDTAFLHGASSGTNTLTSHLNSSDLSGSGYDMAAYNFANVDAYSNSASDVVYLYGASSGTNTFMSDRRGAQPSQGGWQGEDVLAGSGYEIQSYSFHEAFAYSNSASDKAYLYGASTGSNTFSAAYAGASFGGSWYFDAVQGFRNVTAYSSSAADVAELFTLSSGYTYTPVGFKQVKKF
jgi:hypothetical protein